MKQNHQLLKRVLSLVLAFVMIFGVIPAAASAATITGGTKLYLKPNDNWTKGNAWFAAYFFNDSSATWVKMTDDNFDGVYECTSPAGQSYANVIFCRMNSSSTVLDWVSKWDQTNDLVWDGSKNLYTVSAGVWSNGAGSWSAFTPTVVTPTFTVAGAQALCGTDWDTANTDNDMTLNAETGLYEKVFANVAGGTYTFKVVANHEWTYAWGGSGSNADSNGNYLLEVSEPSNVTVTFNLSTKTVGAVVTAIPAVFNVTLTGTNVTVAGEETATEGEDYTATLTAKEGYTLPETVTVKVGETTLAASDYTYADGKVTVPAAKVTGVITITAEGVEIPAASYSVELKGTNVTLTGEKTVTENTEYTAVLAAVEGYDLPETVTVKVGDTVLAAADYTYAEGKVTVPAAKVTGNISITAEGVVKIFNVTFEGTKVTSNGSEKATFATAYTAALSAEEGCILPETLTVKVGDTTLAASDYTYTEGVLTIPGAKVTGNITITVVAEELPAEPETVTIYFNPGDQWPAANAWFSAYYWGDGIEAKWAKLTAAEEAGVYRCEIGAECTSVIFTRNDPAKTGLSWDSKWNQTVDLTIPADGKNYFTITNPWNGLDGKAEGTWSEYIPGSTEPSPGADEYYLIGYINGADYGDGTDSANLGDYKFVDGSVKATFKTDSYVCVKTGDNKTWYMTDGWLGAVDSATLYKTSDLGSDADKLMVPGCVEVTFHLVENADGTLTLSYETDYEPIEDKSGIQDGTTLHAWNWSFANIEANIAKIAAMGYTAVQTSPIQAMKESTNDADKGVKTHWWVYYQPVDFVITTDAGNALGTRDEFASMCAEAEKYGIKIIVDVVANHLGNKTGNDLADAIPEKLTGDEFWHTKTDNIESYENRMQVTQQCMAGLPDLNTANTTLQGYVIDFLKACIDAGADGFRFDAAKHIETPDDDASYASDFWPNVLGAAEAYAKEKGLEDLYIYGETLNTVDGTSIFAYSKYMSVTDNVWGNVLRSNINGGTVNGLTQAYYKAAPASQLVLWAESHDTYATDNASESSMAVTEANINKTWALVASRADAMALYLARPENWETDKLGAAGYTGWANPEVEAVNEFKTAFRGEEETVGVSGKVGYVVRGDKGAVLVNNGTASAVSLAVPMADGSYVDQVSGNTFTVADGTLSGTVGTTGIAVIHNVEYTVTFNGENLTSDGADKATRANAYTATLSAGEGYAVPTAVTVSVDGIALDASDYSYTGGQLTIPAELITGDIVIAAEATLVPAESYAVQFVSTTVESDGESSVKENTAYTAKLTAKTGYTLPEAVTVKVGEITLTEGYTYTKATGVLTIEAAKVTGNIVITANGVPNSYTVTFNGTNVTSNGAATATYGTAYTAALTAGEGYILPETVTVKVGETTLTEGYTYNKSTGALTVTAAKVTGDISITAVGAEKPDNITVYFRNDWIWSDICVYAWDAAGNPTVGAWPGLEMTFVERLNGYDIYSAEIPGDTVNFKFSGINDKNVRDESPNLTSPSSAVAYYMHWDGENKCSTVAYTPGSGDPNPDDDVVTYIIAGNNAAVFGSSWDPSNTANTMTLNETSGLYEKTYENVPVTKLSFKVTNGTWNQNWGSSTGTDGNYEYTVSAVSNVTIRFNAETKAITVEATPTGEVQQPVTEFTIHYRNTGLWSTVNGYIWDQTDNTLYNGAWPGSAVAEDSDHTNWYTVSKSGINAKAGVGVIFSGDDAQTGDILITKNGEYWYDNGKLLTTQPTDGTWPDGSLELVDYEATFHFADVKGWGNVNLYTWTDQGSNPTGSWPGVAMSAEDGFFIGTASFQAPAGAGLNFIFSGNGQTVDLKLASSRFVLDTDRNIYEAEVWVAPTNTDTEGKFNADIETSPEAIAISPIVDGRNITFQYKAPEAASVSVAGTVNNWAGTGMTKNAYGVWSVTLEDVEYGLHEYKFIVDEAWVTDPVNPWVVLDKDNNENSAVLISNPELDNNEITVNVHYSRADGKYDKWNVYGWTNAGSAQYDFADVGGEKVATVTLVGRDVQYLKMKLRKSVGSNKWAEELKEEYSVDLSKTVSGTFDIYIDHVSGDKAASVKQTLGTDVVYSNKISSVELDYEQNIIVVQTNQTVSNPDSAFKLMKDGSEVEGITVIPFGNTYSINLPEGMVLDLVNLYHYTVNFTEQIEKYKDYDYKIGINTVYATEKFADEFTYTGDLGAEYSSNSTTFTVWAPTAENVTLKLYATGSDGEPGAAKLSDYAMEKGSKGVWNVTVEGDMNGVYYTYQVKRDGKTVEAVDPYAQTTGVNGKRGMVIDLDSTDPEGWDKDTNPNPVKSYTDAVIYELHVRDFSNHDSSGVNDRYKGKFMAFTEEGTTVNGEGKTATGIDYLDELGFTHLHLLPIYDYGSVDETLCENFNWGYDPVNYNVPEGSYATDAYDGKVRVSEMKQMVKSLHDHDISVVMDVVYNHVYDADAFCYNNIVPGYFSRYNSNASGCGNDTASEREMVRKYIVESVLYWTEEYHIDGFRFDLVGLLDVQTINEIVTEVHKVRPDVIFYGEGWDMDGTNREPGTEMAKQHNSSKTPGFAYFSDSIRNLLGGSNGSTTGFASGNGGAGQLINEFKSMPTSWGSFWTTNPQQVVQYASCHDNYTLADKLILSLGKNALDGDVAKMNNLAASVYMTAQGIPFIHAGEEMLREKLDEAGERSENSYNASDYVNNIRWDKLNATSPVSYANNVEYYKGLINFRKDHAALRYGNAQDVAANVSGNKIDESLVTFSVKDTKDVDIADEIFIIFNAHNSSKTVSLPAGEWNICAQGNKAGTKSLGTASGTVSVEGISAMILVKGETCDHEWTWTNCEEEGSCSKCGETCEATTHSFTDKASGNLASAADCDNAAEYYVQCDNCDEVSSDKTVSVGKPNEHAFNEKASDKQASAADCTNAAKYYVQCDNCDEVSAEKTVSVGKPNEHAFNEKASDKQASAADCTNAAKYYVQCDNCDEVSAEKSVSVGKPAGHTFKDGKCQVCGEPDPDYGPVVRVYGEDRFETAIKVADELKAVLNVEKFSSVIIASGANFADALAGTYLANVKSAPILLAYKDKQNAQTAAYIKENLVAGGTVYILGGTSAVPASMEQLLTGYNVKRLDGENRFETNLKILKEAGVKEGQEILVCTATNFADSLSASATGMPILLVYNEKGKLTDSQKQYLEGLKNVSFRLVGGLNAVGPAIDRELQEFGSTSRLSGTNRFDTSVLVANHYYKTADYAVMVYAANYPDGLCGGVLAYAKKAPLILTMDRFEAIAAIYTRGKGITDGMVLGGEGLISDDAVRTLFNMEDAEVVPSK